MRAKTNETSIKSSEDLVYEYFRLLHSKDVSTLLQLFDDNAAIYEPFSKSKEGLSGHGAIEPFLRVAIMAIQGLASDIEILTPKQGVGDQERTAIVTFHRGDKVRFLFNFEFTNNIKNNLRRRIKSLHISFL